jgi:hypothetical protein
MFQTVPTELITRLVTDEPPAHDDRAATELQALADQGVQISVAGPTGNPVHEQPPARGDRRRDVPLPGPRRSQVTGPSALRTAPLGADQPSERAARVADLRRR